MNNLNLFKNLKSDLPASIVVFLVAMPLCLGIALASGAPLYAGIISGIVGGIVVGAFSGSALGVSGPAAGLAVIVLNAINDLPSYEIFLVAVMLAGVIQLVMGYVRAGIIGYYFPSSVIHGMLTGIGILIFLKQIPHAFGYDGDVQGDLGFNQADGHNTLSAIYYMLDEVTIGATIITAVSLIILITWETKFMKNLSFTKILPGPLVAVVTGILLNMYFNTIPALIIEPEHLVSIPVADNMDDFLGNFKFPDFAGLGIGQVYLTAVIIAVVASLETLLSLEATDKLDPEKRTSPANLELKAQGVGNIVAGLIGGIPVTQVIVRSSANVQTGGKTKLSTLLHGMWLLLSIIFIPVVLNQIPLATLAAVLLMVGYKLAKPELFKKMYSQGMGQFAPFMVTILAMLLTNLLTGIALGMVVAVFIILKNNLRVPFSMVKGQLKDKHSLKMILSEDVTFLNKAAVQSVLASLPENAHITIDGTKTHFMHFDVQEIFEDFETNAPSRNIVVEKIGFDKINATVPPTHFELKDEDE